jgi:protein O-GlcNAc transferase
LQYRPHFAQAHCNLGIALLKQSKFGEAAEHLELASRLDPLNPDALLNLGITRFMVGDPASAAQSFSAALRLKSDLPEAQYLLALALSRDSKPREAALQATKARNLAFAKGQQDIVAKSDALLRLCQSVESDTATE